MSLRWIALLLGGLMLSGSLLALFKPDRVKKAMVRFPRSKYPGWILTALCCIFGAYYAFKMNMGFLEAYKKAIFLLTPAVFFASVVYMKELLSARSLGGFLLLVAVPILDIARWHESVWRLVIVFLVYVWIIYGLVLLLSPWYFRKTVEFILARERWFKVGAAIKALFGLLLILLSFLAY